MRTKELQEARRMWNHCQHRCLYQRQLQAVALSTMKKS